MMVALAATIFAAVLPDVSSQQLNQNMINQVLTLASSSLLRAVLRDLGHSLGRAPFDPARAIA
jgi:hypothetical protein